MLIELLESPEGMRCNGGEGVLMYLVRMGCILCYIVEVKTGNTLGYPMIRTY
jgi:hypothetical protein